jgi:hypothetical protein
MNTVTLPNGTRVRKDWLNKIAKGEMDDRDFEKLRKLAETSPTEVCFILFEWDGGDSP